MRRLLDEAGLDASDIADGALAGFLVAQAAGAVEGVVGVASDGDVGLLRSLATATNARRRGIGRALVAEAERRAAGQGVRRLCLLTTDAATYFERLGYRRIERQDAPRFIRETAQFRGLCPASSTLMEKWL